MKRCARCLTELALTEFACKSKSSDGRQSWCRECQSEYHANWRGNGGRRKQVKPTPKMARCHRIVAQAVKSGEIRKSLVCEECRSDRKRTQAHHDDYDWPRDVRWLCDRCHREWHHKNGQGANP